MEQNTEHCISLSLTNTPWWLLLFLCIPSLLHHVIGQGCFSGRQTGSAWECRVSTEKNDARMHIFTTSPFKRSAAMFQGWYELLQDRRRDTHAVGKISKDLVGNAERSAGEIQTHKTLEMKARFRGSFSCFLQGQSTREFHQKDKTLANQTIAPLWPIT